MKKAFVLVILAVLLAASGCAVSADSATKKPMQSGESDIVLPGGMDQVEYIYIEDPENQTIVSKIGSGDLKTIDLSTADAETLKEQSYTDYDKTFGEVENPREAANVAAIVVSEVYEKDPQEEAPFSVFYNGTADAWIVRGSLPEGWVGGVFLMVIGRESGEIIMIQHGK